KAGIAIVPKRLSVARRAREREAVLIEAQVAKPLRIPPAAKPVGTVLIRVVRVVAYFADEPCAVARTERRARGVAQFRAADPGAGRVAVEHPEEQSHSLVRIDPGADGGCGERVARAAGPHVDRRPGRPTRGRGYDQ